MHSYIRININAYMYIYKASQCFIAAIHVPRYFIPELISLTNSEYLDKPLQNL